LRYAGHNLLKRPGFLVVAKVEDALHEAGGMPPGCQVPQQGGFACTAHTAYKQDVAFCEQGFLDL